MSVNQKILDEIVKHEIDMHRLRDTDVRKLISIYNRMIEEIKQKLKAIDPTAPAQKTYQEQRLQKLLEQSYAIVNTYMANEIPNEHYDMMVSMANAEADTFAVMFNGAIGFEVMTVGLPATMIKNIVNETMLEGIPVKEWWKRQGEDIKFRYKQEMTQGMMQGETINQLTARINNNVAPVPRNHAEALARTGFQSVVQRTRAEMYEENADIIKGIEWVATLDTRTTKLCAALDGQTWYMPDYRKWTATRKFPGYPPIHWNCRSTTTPIVKSYEELAGVGGNKELARELDKPDNSAKRAAMDGTVPKGYTYDQWLKKQPVSRQKEVLGPKTYELWKDGKITSVKQLVDKSGEPLTYKQLYEKYGM